MRDWLARLRGMLFILSCQLLGKNIRIGRGLKMYKKLTIDGPGRVELGENCVVAGVPGDRAQYVSIDTQSPDACITIGNNVVLSAARISARYAISIGNDVVIEESGIVDTDFHSIKRDRDSGLNETPNKCKIIVGNGVLIGARSFVSKGVSIGENTVAAPGSIIATSLKAGMVVCGNPARPMV
jgi:acetyltransferase-like isoleucine patch superfamily enzyme